MAVPSSRRADPHRTADGVSPPSEPALRQLMRLQAVVTAADTLVVAGLAGSIFFSVGAGPARGRVALALVLMIMPFVLLAPVLDRLLDRLLDQRRAVLALTLAIRAVLVWLMAGSMDDAPGVTPLRVYLGAIAVLLCRRLYGATRGQLADLLVPPDRVRAANARVSVTGLLTIAVCGPFAAGTTAGLGPQWSLRFAFVLFAGAVVAAMSLPARADAPLHPVSPISGEGGAAGGGEGGGGVRRLLAPRRTWPQRRDVVGDHPLFQWSERNAHDDPGSWSFGPAMVLGIGANAALRGFTGFVTLFLVFTLRSTPISGAGGGAGAVVLLIVFVCGGSIAGFGCGDVLHRFEPAHVLVVLLASAAISAAWTSWTYGLAAVLLLGFVAGVNQSLGAACLDDLVLREVPERARPAVVARSTTIVQAAWVVGAALGLTLSMPGPNGLALVAAVTLAATGTVAAQAATVSTEPR